VTKLTRVHCGSGRVQPFAAPAWLDRAVLLVGGRTCRCHQGSVRFARFGGSLVRIADVHRVAGRLLIVLAMMTAAGTILASIVWCRHKTAFSPFEFRNFTC